jgi:Viral BACON domain
MTVRSSMMAVALAGSLVTCPMASAQTNAVSTLASAPNSQPSVRLLHVAPQDRSLSARTTAIEIAGRPFSVTQQSAAQPALNLSRDLVTLGIAATNMVPNQSSLDAGPLFVAGVEYAKSHGIATVVADKGAYYFLSLTETNAHFAVRNIDNMTIDLHGADLIFTHPLYYGMIVYYSTNAVVENFTADYQPLPFTQLRVVAVDTVHQRIQYTVEPGWQDLTAFNSPQIPPGISFFLIDVHIFRNGQPTFGSHRMATRGPFSGTTFTISNDNGDPAASLAAVRPGDIAVVAMKSYGEPVGTNHCDGCTLRNITVFASASSAVQAIHTQSSVFERVYSIPKPGTDRLVSSFGIAPFPVTGPNNTIRLSRAIRTMDDGLAMGPRFIGTVQTQVSSRRVIVEGSGGPSVIADGDTEPNGSPVSFQRPSDGAIVGSAIIVSQSAPTGSPARVTFDLDRDLPGSLAGTVMFTTAADQNGANSVIERSTVQSTAACCKGIYLNGLANSAVRGNYIRHTAFSGIFLVQGLVSGDAPTAPLTNLSIANNVIDGTNMTSDWWWFEFGSIQSVTLTTAFDLINGSPFSNLNITNNFIADSGRSGIWLGNTNGGSVTGNYLLNPNARPDLANAYGPRIADATKPLVVDTTSAGISVSNNAIDTTSGRLFVTDAQYNELAAYAPGGTIRLNASDIGSLASPVLTLTDADGITVPATIQSVSAHAIDVQVPAGAALGGAYITLVAGGTKHFGTLFVDSQDNIPAVNGCTYEASPSSTAVPANGGSLSFLVVTQPACAYQTSDSDSFVTGASGIGTRVISVGFNANPGGARNTTIEIAGQPFTITQSASSATMKLERSSLNFAAVSNGAAFVSQTSPQTVRLLQSGTGTVTWTASSDKPWLVVSPASGTGPATLSVSVKFDAAVAAPGSASGSISVVLTGATNTVGPVAASLTTVAATTPASIPFGSFDTPAGDGAVLDGSIAVTGWTLDNVGVQRVELWRDLQPGETTPPFTSTPSDPRHGKVFISNATFVDGARPDVEALYPTTPLNYRAGWGYLLLTWGLWNQGNGTYHLYAFAFDEEHNVATIGSKTIVVNNNGATKPFGSIDTPAIGGDAGTLPNFGWGLTPKVNGVATCSIPANGVQVSIDSGPLQPVVFGDVRTDIAGAFTGFSNSAAAGGHFIFDWSTLKNGTHTIGWLIADDCNRADGVGSRFFNVTTGTNVIVGETASMVPAAARGAAPSLAARRESDAPITASKGYGELPLVVDPGLAGSRTIEVKQGDRIELRLPHGFDAAYQLGPGGQVRALPIGATWDSASAIFYWHPDAGFLGRYRIVFANQSQTISVRVVVVPW